MTLLLDNEFKPLPPDKAVDTRLFLEAVSHLPSFFGEYGPPEVGPSRSALSASRRRLSRIFLWLLRPRNVTLSRKMDETTS